jgi:hypothetical protein
MTTYRESKDADHPFTRVSNETIADRSLTLEARMVLIYLLSKPDDWTVIIADLVKLSPAGWHKIKSILDELEDHDYIVRRPQKKATEGKFGTADIDVYERPPVRDNRERSRPGDMDIIPGETVRAYPSTAERELLTTEGPTTESLETTDDGVFCGTSRDAVGDGSSTTTREEALRQIADIDLSIDRIA